MGAHAPTEREIFDEIPIAEWRHFSNTKKSLFLLEALLTGKYGRFALTREIARKLPEGVYHKVKEWEVKGYIEGYVPLLTEKGQRYLEGLRLVEE